MPSAATWTDLEIIILTEVSQRKTNIMASLICGILKNDTNELIDKTEINSQTHKINMVTKGDGAGGSQKLGIIDTQTYYCI